MNDVPHRVKKRECSRLEFFFIRYGYELIVFEVDEERKEAIVGGSERVGYEMSIEQK